MQAKLDESQMAARIVALGRRLAPDIVAATADLFRPHVPRGAPEDIVVTRHGYGPHLRHRLSIFAPRGARRSLILVFVPGGGLAAPLMAEEQGPYFDNVGLWAARAGMVGVVMSYRLAPEAKWPDGGADVAMALRWLRDNADAHGGDAEDITLFGHSAGAGHVATCVANAAILGAPRPVARRLVLVSGPYNIGSLPGEPNKAYYGDDPAAHAACDTTDGVVTSALPALIAAAEHDPPEFQAQARELATAIGPGARVLDLEGDNHFSPPMRFGAREDRFQRELRAFIQNHPRPGF